MNYEDFVCVVQTQMQEKLGEEVQIQLRQIRKNNSVLLDALSIQANQSGIAPTIYLNDFYQEYLEGKTLPELTDQMVEIYEQNRLRGTFDTSFYADYEKVRPRLACRLINRQKNEKLLKEVPYLPFLDLAVVVYYYFEDCSFGTGTILVYESHRKSWRVSEEELFAAARENTLKIQPAEFMSMREILQKYQEDVPAGEEEEMPLQPMYVLSNRSNYFGAAGILFDSVLQKIAGQLADDFWILPSSIHECIIVPASLLTTREELQNMVRQINRLEVAQEDFLSDEVYYYEREIHKLTD